jgi:hypothetical protein
MEGDDAVRFCRHCEKNVYQLSAMTSDQVEALLDDKKGNLCARFYQRADGTVMTADCSRGRKRIRRRRAVVGLGAGIASMVGVALIPDAPQQPRQEDLGVWAGSPYDRGLMGRVSAVPDDRGMAIMGLTKVSVPTDEEPEEIEPEEKLVPAPKD